MKRFKVLNVVILILILSITGFSQSQEQNKNLEAADDLLIKFIEYFDKKDMDTAFDYLGKALELDPKKLGYIEILKNFIRGKFAETLKLLKDRKDQSPGAKEHKVIQILAAETHFKWAEALRKEYDYLNAIKHYEASYRINIIYKHKDSAMDLNNIGFLYNALGQKKKAFNYYNKALRIRREIEDRFGEATTLNNIGAVYYSLGQKQKALKYYEKALLIRRKVEDRSGEASTLNNIGIVYYTLGQKQKALEYYEKALPIFREVDDRSEEATALNNIGLIYSDLGQKQMALKYCKMALSIYTSVEDRSGEATSLNNIGMIYSDLGQNQKALDYYQKALQIRHQVKDLPGDATTLINIGSIYSDLGQKQKALEYYEKALSTFHELKDRFGIAISFNNIGMVYSDLGQKQKALEYYEKALPTFHDLGDRSNEATTLNNTGGIYSDLGQKQKALEYYKKALPTFHDVGDRSNEATTLNNIGGIHSDLGQKQLALKYYEKGLSIYTSIGDRSGEATSLNNIGGIYSFLGQNQKALEYYEKALTIRRQVGDRSNEATTLNNIGGIHSDLGQKQLALEYYEKGLSIYTSIGDRSGEATSLNNIGGIYSFLGQNQKALEYYEEALTIRKQVGDRSAEATTLNGLGMVYSALGQNQKALEYFEKALPIRSKIGDRSGGAATLNGMGLIYSNLGQKQKALEYFEKALLILRELGDRSGEAAILNNIGGIYTKLGQKKKALVFAEKVLSIYQELGERAQEVVLFHNLMLTSHDINKNSLAIFYGKQAVNGFQYLRQNINNLDIKTKSKFLMRSKDLYRILAFLLISSGRIAEAKQVRDILKDEEYFAFIQKNGTAYTPQYAPIDYTGFERKWIDQQNTIVNKIYSISSPYHVLLINKIKTPVEEKKRETLKRNLDKAKKEYRNFMVRMKKAFEAYGNPEKPDIEALIKKSNPLKEYLKSLDRDNNGKTAILHFLVYKGRLAIIITTPTYQTVKQSQAFDQQDFNIMIYNYRYLIKELARLPRITNPSSKEASKISALSMQKQDIENKLYRFIFQPADDYLKKYGATTLLVSLDGVLRYIPLGSLWDGQHYLLQKYRFVRITPSGLKHVSGEKPVFEKKILGMAASKGGSGFTPLPHAGNEIRDIVHDREKGCKGFIKGNALIDKDFTRTAMVNSLKTASYPIVHIASHFKFSPGNETSNQLLLGDGATINLGDIRKAGKLFDGVKLLVLSACQTGAGGNGDEIEGFGRLAQQCGAECVVASLWSVDDKSTRELMVNFYSILKEGKVSNKIEALRLAQLQLAGLEDLINASKEVKNATSGKKTAYSQSYYWAPFIMMGNWR